MEYATMHKGICLDKFMDGDGVPAPVTFSVRKVINGHHPWQQGNGNMTLCQGADTLAWAVKELHSKFLMEMQERGYTLMVDGGSTFEDLQEDGETFKTEVFRGESGWYQDAYTAAISNHADYPLSSYPLKWEDWVKNEVHSFSYDNYSVCIVTSNGDLVY